MYYSAMCESCGYDNNEYEKNMKAVQCAGPDIVIFTFGGDGCRGVSGRKPAGGNRLLVPDFQREIFQIEKVQ